MNDEKNDNDDIDQSSAPLIEHLAELRNRLIKSVVAFAICMILSFTIATPIFNFLADPIVNILKLNGQAPDLIFTGLQQGFMVNIRISCLEVLFYLFHISVYRCGNLLLQVYIRTKKEPFSPF